MSSHIQTSEELDPISLESNVDSSIDSSSVRTSSPSSRPIERRTLAKMGKSPSFLQGEIKPLASPIKDTQIKVESEVLHEPTGKIGRVKFIGDIPNYPGTWVGVCLDAPTGKHDGTLNGVVYFKTEPLFGCFWKLKDVSLSKNESPKSIKKVYTPRIVKKSPPKLRKAETRSKSNTIISKSNSKSNTITSKSNSKSNTITPSPISSKYSSFTSNKSHKERRSTITPLQKVKTETYYHEEISPLPIFHSPSPNSNSPKSKIPEYQYSIEDEMDNCNYCGRRIEHRGIEFENSFFHPTCFKCERCHSIIRESDDFFVKDGKPLCLSCPPQPKKVQTVDLKGAKCRKCLEPTTYPIILGRSNVTYWHPHCFTCNTCGVLINKRVWEKEGLPYCLMHKP